MTFLVDMDGVLADLDRHFLTQYQTRYPDKPAIPLAERTTFYIQDQYPEELQPLVTEILFAPGFFLDLPVIPGAKEALEEMKNSHEVFICTSPLLANPTCTSDKIQWLERHFGAYWTEKLIISKDKTMVHGDVLIDDKPHITGAQTPSWYHVLYTQPYNRFLTSKSRITWTNWKGF